MYYDNGSLVLGRVAAIPIKVHWTFGFLLLVVVYYIHQNGLSIVEGLWFFSLVALMFCFVIIHEYGHALTARRFGVDTKDIIISPIGGVARLSFIPKRALHEFYIAIAGPAVNLTLLILLLSIQLLFNNPILPSTDVINPITHIADYIGILLYINAALVIFNLIPAFPMDGGRILRSLLAMALKDHHKATTIASYIGQIISIVFVIFGAYFSHYMLLFIGIYVFLTARAEGRYVAVDAKLNKVTARDIMRTDGYKIFEDSAQEELVVNQNYLVYTDQNNLVGLFNGQWLDSHEFVPQHGLGAYLTQQYGRINYNMPLNRLFEIMNTHQWHLVIVMDEAHHEVGAIDRPLLRHYIDDIS